MKINLKRVDDAYQLLATNPRGDQLFSDGTSKIGAGENGWRPMELLLVSLAGCSAIDIISVLKKQRQKIEDFRIEIEGERVEGVPSPYKSIDIHFFISGEIKPKKLEKAIDLTKGKYCSVYFSLHPDINVEYSYTLE